VENTGGDYMGGNQITVVENVERDYSKYRKPIVFWLNKMTVTLSQNSFIPM